MFLRKFFSQTVRPSKTVFRADAVVDKIVEIDPISSEWGVWFLRLIKLAEHILLNSPYDPLAYHLVGLEPENWCL